MSKTETKTPTEERTRPVPPRADAESAEPARQDAETGKPEAAAEPKVPKLRARTWAEVLQGIKANRAVLIGDFCKAVGMDVKEFQAIAESFVTVYGKIANANPAGLVAVIRDALRGSDKVYTAWELNGKQSFSYTLPANSEVRAYTITVKDLDGLLTAIFVDRLPHIRAASDFNRTAMMDYPLVGVETVVAHELK